jgi:hypothetical protein
LNFSANFRGLIFLRCILAKIILSPVLKGKIKSVPSPAKYKLSFSGNQNIIYYIGQIFCYKDELGLFSQTGYDKKTSRPARTGRMFPQAAGRPHVPFISQGDRP